MQVAEHLDKFLEDLGFFSLKDLLKSVLVNYCVVNSIQTVFHTFWRFICNFDTHLQDSEWEFVSWVAGQPQTEVSMCYVLLRIVRLLEGCFKTSDLVKGQVGIV